MGVVIATCAFASAANASTIDVTTTSDDPVSSGCSLRDAISSANTDSAVGGCAAGSGTDTVVVPAGTFRLTDINPGAEETNNATGDLNILSPLTISGAGPLQTIIDGNGADRVIRLAQAAAGSVIDGVTITHGHAPSGNPNGGVNVSLDPATPALGNDGEGGASGGGIYTQARLTLSDCAIRDNAAGDGGAGANAQGASGADGIQGTDGGGAQGGHGGSGGNGGGLYSHAAAVTISHCQITDNAAGNGGPGGAATGGRAGNSSDGSGARGGYAIAGTGGAGGRGGGIYADRTFGSTVTLTITSSIINDNHAGAGAASNDASGGTGGHGGSTGGTPQAGGPAGIVGSTSTGGTPAGGTGGIGGAGGGIYAALNTTIADSDVSGNTAGSGHAGAQARGGTGGSGVNGFTTSGEARAFAGDGGSGGAGGGILSGVSLALTRTGLTHNHAGSGGPGGGTVQGTTFGGALTFDRSGAGGAGGSGGGLEAIGSATRSLTDVTVDSNVAGSGANGGSGSGNLADDSFGGAGGNGGSGGGIDSAGGAVSLERSTISGNSLGDPGSGGSGNTTTGADGTNGAGGALNGATGTSASATIFATNDTPQCVGAVGDGGHDLVTPAAPGCPGTVADPQLGALADNGGISPTRAIPASSPAANAYACTGVDQRGATRPFGPGCDIGAYEFASPLAGSPTVQRGDTQVVVHATITPNVRARVTFNFGRTKNYGGATPVQTITGSGGQPVSATITGLSRNTTYHVRVSATNGDGTSTSSDVAFTTLSKPPPGGNPTALKVSKLSVRPGTFAAAKPHAKRHRTPLGTTIRYTLSAKATVTLTFLRRSVGKRASHGRCVASRQRLSRKARCFRYTRVASFSHASNRGATKLAFSGLIRNHALAPGTYHLTAAARAGREHSRPVTVTLTIVSR